LESNPVRPNTTIPTATKQPGPFRASMRCHREVEDAVDVAKNYAHADRTSAAPQLNDDSVTAS
jgi:hypothetical protein